MRLLTTARVATCRNAWYSFQHTVARHYTPSYMHDRFLKGDKLPRKGTDYR